MSAKARKSGAARRHHAATEREARQRRLRMVIGAGAAAVAAVVALILIGGLFRGGNDAVAQHVAPTAGYTLGSPDASVTVTAWEDFQCPICKAANASVLKQLEEDYVNTGKVKLVYQQYPFLGAESQLAAEASQCAADQGQFWPYHDALFAAQGAENSGALNANKLKSIAADLGFDTTAFNQCFDSGAHKDSVAAEKAEGTKLGVTGTPTLFVDGVKVTDWRDYSTLTAMIDAALQANAG
jgi:protein-disulfide isomerase